VAMPIVFCIILACNQDKILGPRVQTFDMAQPDMAEVVQPGLIENSPGARIEGDVRGNRIINSPGAVIRSNITTNKWKWGKFTITEDGAVKDVPPPWGKR